VVAVRGLRRWRPIVALATLCIVVSACTGGSGGPSQQQSAETRGGKIIASFAAAWPKVDVASFRGIVDEPSVAVHDIAGHDSDLGITSTQVDLLDDLACSSNACEQHAQVTHQLSGAGSWSYKTLIKASLNQGQWLVNWTPGTFNPDLTQVTTLVRHRTLPPRAPILDRDGVALTPERAIVRIGVQPSRVRPQTYSALGVLLDINTVALQERVQSAEPNWFVPVIDLRRGQFDPLRAKLLKVPGIVIDKARRALAPTPNWGRAVLGTVGPASSDTLKNAGPETLPSDEVGLNGLQLAFQRSLAGRPGLRIDLVERQSGDVLNRILTRAPRGGQPLNTSLDLQAQNAAETAVAGATDTTSLVVVKASTGEILAAANAPGPTTYDTALIGQYAPGSTFKVVSAGSLLAHHQVTPGLHVACPNTTVIDGKQFKNYEQGITGPNPTFADDFAASCNTTMVGFAHKLTGSELSSTASQFGIGAAWDLGLPSYSGSVPADDDLVTRAADMIGQGKVLASPLSMAMVAAAVDSGVSRTPTLLPQLDPGRRLTELDPSVDAKLRHLMRLVVTQGTGAPVNLPGLPVHAKTGTAEYQDGSQTRTNAWMIGYRGDIAFAAFVANGSSGGHDAGPIVDSLLTALPDSLYR
jgi:cell division protein FtsI/penicillin-binding protein 2